MNRYEDLINPKIAEMPLVTEWMVGKRFYYKGGLIEKALKCCFVDGVWFVRTKCIMPDRPTEIVWSRLALNDKIKEVVTDVIEGDRLVYEQV